MKLRYQNQPLKSMLLSIFFLAIDFLVGIWSHFIERSSVQHQLQNLCPSNAVVWQMEDLKQLANTNAWRSSFSWNYCSERSPMLVISWKWRGLSWCRQALRDSKSPEFVNDNIETRLGYNIYTKPCLTMCVQTMLYQRIRPLPQHFLIFTLLRSSYQT